jgi:opacity protein-like surface antigen
MGTWKHLVAAAAASAVLVASTAATAEEQPRPGITKARGSQMRVSVQRAGRSYQEPAFAAGFDSGFGKGETDGRDGERYDPVRHKEYRDADRGYTESYGSKDGYRNNFRAGFRQGYEEGYRTGNRTK